MADRPIIFSGPMVQALLAGRKSQTRRVLKKPAAMDALAVFGSKFLTLPGNIDLIGYAPGDRLYVREAFSYEALDVDRNGFMPPWYWADGNPSSGNFTRPKPSIHMPRWASRITLTVTEVRVQRLQEISEADCFAEGVEQFGGGAAFVKLADAQTYSTPRGCYHALWNSLHGPDAWGANPWVVAVSFTVDRRNIDAIPRQD